MNHNAVENFRRDRHQKTIEIQIAFATAATPFGTLVTNGNASICMFDTLVEQMKETESVTEKLKEDNPIEWIQRINNICNRAEEITINEINK